MSVLFGGLQCVEQPDEDGRTGRVVNTKVGLIRRGDRRPMNKMLDHAFGNSLYQLFTPLNIHLAVGRDLYFTDPVIFWVVTHCSFW